MHGDGPADRTRPRRSIRRVRSSVARLLGRLIGVVAVVVGVTALTWLAMRVLRPAWFAGDERGVPAQLASELDRTFLHFDLGRSWAPPNDLIANVIRSGLPADLSLLLGATAFGLVAGAAAGTYCGARPRTVLSRGLEGAAAFFLFAPLYVVGLSLVLLFGSDVALIEVGVHIPRAYVPFRESPLGWAGAMIVPCILVGLPLAALLMRLTRASVRTVLDEDFIRAADAKGLRERTVLRRHVLPAAGGPVISAAGMTINLTITNVVLIEAVFGIPGVFGHLKDAIAYGDFPMLMGVTIVGAVLIALANLLADIALERLDPRVRA
jgi:peptide/nickel transport system permease protein